MTPNGDIASDEALRLLIEAVEDYAIFMLDPTGQVASWNAGAQKIKGYRREEIIGQHFSIFYLPDDIAEGKPQRELAAATADGRIEDEGWRIRRDGSRFWANVIITAVYNPLGVLIGFAKVTRDMTERLRMAGLEHSRALSAHAQTAREDEQRRIARELHDDLGQQLVAMKMDVSVLQKEFDGSLSPTAVDKTRRLQRQIDTMIASVRRIASDLRPVLLDDLGLLAAIEWLANEFHHRYGIEVTARMHTGDLVFSEQAASFIFRIVQEALNNVTRHSDATEVTIELNRTADSLAMSIADNGKGAAPDLPRRPESFGLLGMRERVHQLGGTLDINGATGNGFRITITFPLYAIRHAEPASPGRA